MVIVILNKRPLKRMRYNELFPGAKVHLITSTNHSTPEEIEAVRDLYQSVHVFEQYDGNSAIEDAVIEIASTVKIDRIIALSEQDILRAARLRDHLGIPGMRYNEALNFRDKAVMKTILEKYGVTVPRFAKVDFASDALIFVRDVGYPVVLKPTRGAGSMGVSVIRHANDLKDSLSKLFTSDFDRETGYMIEEFVEGEMYHVDGLAHLGEVIFVRPSKYINSCLSFHNGDFLGSTMLELSSNKSKELTSVTNNVLRALADKSSFSFHAEIFECAKTGKYLVCEIACRAGGGPIVDAILDATGIDLTRCSALLETNPDAVYKLIENGNQGIRGWCLFPPKKATLVKLPDECGLPSVTSFKRSGKEDTNYNGGKNSIDCIATAIVQGHSTEECSAAVSATADWFSNNTVWK